jgi:hypothetical protein
MEKFGEGPDLRVGLTSAEQPGATMAQQPMSRVTEVAACTMAAAHRRDHDHGLGADACHPHVVEIVHLGRRAVCVCHDCQLDSGFLPCREAEALAAGHRDLTLHISVKLRSAWPGPAQVPQQDAANEITSSTQRTPAGTSKGWRGISYSDVPKEVVIDFWVVDLDGTPVVVDLWHQIDASSELVDQATRVRDSISFVTPE